jgi:hypothetical protein
MKSWNMNPKLCLQNIIHMREFVTCLLNQKRANVDRGKLDRFKNEQILLHNVPQTDVF